MISVLAAALPLAGCGRKGPLDPPPGGSQLGSLNIQTPVSGRAGPPLKEKQPEYDEDGRPIAPEGRKKKLFLDWLID
jgi:hypothetical protein